MYDLLDKLSERLYWRVTYEDPPVLDERELTTELSPNGNPWHVLRNRYSASMSVRRTRTLSPVKVEVIGKALDTIRLAGDNTEYRVVYDGDYIHVSPIKIRSKNGELVTFEPMLDTRVSIPQGSYVLISLLNKVLSQVASKRGVGISIGTIPTNLFLQSQVTLQATDSSAQDIISQAVEGVRLQRLKDGDIIRTNWYLGYSHTQGHYFFNARTIRSEEDNTKEVSGPAMQEKVVEPTQKQPSTLTPYSKSKE